MTNLTPHADARSNGFRSDASQDGDAELRTDLHVALTRVTHDINNPLAVISGNAQLLLELARALELDPDVAKPIQDIEAASQQLAGMVARLNALNASEGPEGSREEIGGDGV